MLIAFLLLLQSHANCISGIDQYAKADSLYFKGLYHQAKEFYKQSGDSFLKCNNLEKAATSFNDAGICYQTFGDLDSSIYFFQKALKLDSARRDILRVLIRSRNLVIASLKKGDFKDAIELALNKLNQAEMIEDTFLIGSYNMLLGSIYAEQSKYERSKHWFIKASLTFKKLENHKFLSHAIENHGLILHEQDELDSALIYFREAIRLRIAYDSTSIDNPYHNIGRLFTQLGQYDSARYYLNKAYELRKFRGDERGQATTSNMLAKYYIETGTPLIAKSYLDFALDYASRSNNQDLQMECMELHAEYYRAIGRSDLAYDYLQSWSLMRDSVFNEQRLATEKAQAAYDVEQSRKAQRLAESQSELVKQASDRLFLVTLLVSMVGILIGVSAFVFYRQRRTLQKLTTSLEEQKQHIAMLNRQNFHFTKNSLAGVVSMMNLQIRRMENTAVRDSLTGEKLRMETINLLYNQLFSASLEAGETVDLSKYLEEIIQNTVETIRGYDQVNIQTNTNPLHVTNDKALSLGIMINEVCLNACKYAHNSKGLTFTLSIQKASDQTCQLTFSDNGSGFPKDVQWQDSKSFGLQLIRAMAKDLGAEIEVESNESGVSYYFSFHV